MDFWQIIFMVAVFAAAIFFLRIKFFKLKIYFTPPEKTVMTELNGIIHFHSAYSDGSGKMDDIINTARALKADFLISSDHNTLKPRTDGIEGYYKELLYFAGEEINTEFGHLLAVGIDAEVKKGDYENVLRSVKSQGGAAIICHPHNWWTPWKNFDVKGFDGIEIINLDSQWRGMNPLYIPAVMLSYKINPFYALHFLTHKPLKTIKFWDGAQEAGAMKTGIASIDAHSNVKLSKKIRIKFPKYSELFSVARTHVFLDKKLSGDLADDKKYICEALLKGRCYFAFDLFGNPKGFYFKAIYKDREYLSGDSVNIGGYSSAGLDKKVQNAIICAGIGINGKKNKYAVNLFRNGEKIASSFNKELVYQIQIPANDDDGGGGRDNDFSGHFFYRVEIDVYFGFKKITYLYSNNIEIYMAGE